MAATIIASTMLGTATFGATPHNSAGGTVHVIAYGDGEGVGSTILLTGAIGDSGSVFNVDSNGTIDPNSGYAEVTLVRGSFIVNIQALGKAIMKAYSSTKVNPNSCSFEIVVTAPGNKIVAGSGTGA